MSAKRKARSREKLQLCAVAPIESAYAFSWDPRWGDGGDIGTGDIAAPPKNSDFRQARRWSTMNLFVGEIIRLRQFFYNYGMLGSAKRLRNPKNPKSEVVVEYLPGIQPLNRSDADKLNEWKEKNRVAVTKYFTAAWSERLIINNVIGFWRKDAPPLTLDPEMCEYTDLFGQELLKVRLGLTDAQIDKMQLPAAQKARLKREKPLEIKPTDDLFFFDVVKPTRTGKGLAWPLLVSLFHTCAQQENLEVSDRELADACRVIYEQHLCGHEIKSGLRAGAKDNFLKEVRAKAIEKACKNAKGRKLLVVNFDHLIKIGAGLPDPKQFAASRYDSPRERIALWSMPLGQMVLGKTVNPFLMTLLRVQAIAERELMEPHFHRVLTEAFKVPVKFHLQWDSTIFWDSRLMLDVLKTAYTSGALSQETLTTKTGFDRASELALKADEAELPQECREPGYDPAHSAPKKEKGGKPPGTIDKS